MPSFQYKWLVAPMEGLNKSKGGGAAQRWKETAERGSVVVSSLVFRPAGLLRLTPIETDEGKGGIKWPCRMHVYMYM